MGINLQCTASDETNLSREVACAQGSPAVLELASKIATQSGWWSHTDYLCPKLTPLPGMVGGRGGRGSPTRTQEKPPQPWAK